jgi:hypothetical protein
VAYLLTSSIPPAHHLKLTIAKQTKRLPCRLVGRAHREGYTLYRNPQALQAQPHKYDPRTRAFSQTQGDNLGPATDNLNTHDTQAPLEPRDTSPPCCQKLAANPTPTPSGLPTPARPLPNHYTNPKLSTFKSLLHMAQVHNAVCCPQDGSGAASALDILPYVPHLNPPHGDPSPPSVDAPQPSAYARPALRTHLARDSLSTNSSRSLPRTSGRGTLPTTSSHNTTLRLPRDPTPTKRTLNAYQSGPASTFEQSLVRSSFRSRSCQRCPNPSDERLPQPTNIQAQTARSNAETTRKICPFA